MALRLLYTNLVLASGTTLTVSSEQSGTPRSWLQDGDRGLKWRSKVGWNIVSGVNDKIDFNRGGVKAATLTAGNYATSTLMAAAIVVALEAADSTPVWACSYNSGTGIFTISSDLAFTLLFSTGTNLATSVHLDLGYTSTDKGSATSQVAEGASYKSREWIKVDLGAATAVTGGIVIEHNLGASGTITQQGHTADTAAGWLAPDTTLTLTGDATIRIAYQASASKRYWRLLINDVASNTAGYTEIGLWFAGAYVDPAKNYRTYARQWQRLSEVVTAVSGAHKRDVRTPRSGYSLTWENITTTTRDTLRTFITTALNKDVFLAFDPTNAPTDVVYGFFAGDPSEAPTTGLLWTVTVEFGEALP